MSDKKLDPVDDTPSDDENPNYQPPPEKTLAQILDTDKEDSSLQQYKKTLLGETNDPDAFIFQPDDPRKVIVKQLSLLVDGRDDMTLDLSGSIDKLKDTPFVIKEGVSYKIKIDFQVQREIVTGLKYVQKIYRMAVPVEKMSQMIGSYPPKKECHSFVSPLEEMPSGILYRGHYVVKSLFTDDDKNEHLKWEWSFKLEKDW